MMSDDQLVFAVIFVARQSIGAHEEPGVGNIWYVVISETCENVTVRCLYNSLMHSCHWLGNRKAIWPAQTMPKNIKVQFWRAWPLLE